MKVCRTREDPELTESVVIFLSFFAFKQKKLYEWQVCMIMNFKRLVRL